jgi:hypothetical protein
MVTLHQGYIFSIFFQVGSLFQCTFNNKLHDKLSNYISQMILVLPLFYIL